MAINNRDLDEILHQLGCCERLSLLPLYQAAYTGFDLHANIFTTSREIRRKPANLVYLGM
jgi:hypothetical protein